MENIPEVVRLYVVQMKGLISHLSADIQAARFIAWNGGNVHPL